MIYFLLLVALKFLDVCVPAIGADAESQSSHDAKTTKRLQPINNVAKNPNYRDYFPQAPVVHAYDPSLFGSDLKDFPVIVKFKVDVMRPYLPDEIAKVIHDKNDDNMDLYWVPQIRDTNNTNLMRYHYWLSPNGSTESWRHMVAGFKNPQRFNP